MAMLGWIGLLDLAGSAPDFDNLDTVDSTYGELLPLQPFLPITIEAYARNALLDAFRAIHMRVNRNAYTVRTTTGDAVADHEVVLADASAATVVVTMLPAADWADKVISVKKIDGTSNPVLVAAQSGEQIDGTATKTLASQYAVLRLATNGLAWYTV